MPVSIETLTFVIVACAAYGVVIGVPAMFRGDETRISRGFVAMTIASSIHMALTTSGLVKPTDLGVAGDLGLIALTLGAFLYALVDAERTRLQRGIRCIYRAKKNRLRS